MNSLCLPSNEQSRASPVKYDMTNVESLMCAEDDGSRENYIVEDYKQKRHARAYVYEWTEFIS